MKLVISWYQWNEITIKMNLWKIINWHDNFTENVGVLFKAIETCQEWWKDIDKLKTKWCQQNEITIKMNLWEITYWQENLHDESLTLIWIHRKLSGLMEGDKKVGNILIWM